MEAIRAIYTSCYTPGNSSTAISERSAGRLFAPRAEITRGPAYRRRKYRTNPIFSLIADYRIIPRPAFLASIDERQSDEGEIENVSTGVARVPERYYATVARIAGLCLEEPQIQRYKFWRGEQPSRNPLARKRGPRGYVNRAFSPDATFF